MKKYLALYRTSLSASEQMKSMTPEQGKAGMDMWMAWFAANGAGIVDGGAPLGDSTVLKGGAATGPGFIGGYSIVQAQSLDAAKAMFEKHPHFMAPGASIELLELLAMPGM